MKTRFTWLGIVAAFILGISTSFVSCDNDVNAVVKYVGKVVYAGSTRPFTNLEVKVTNGEKIHDLSHTDDYGAFSLTVKVGEIDGNYYVLIGDASCVTKRIELSGFGQAEVDLGTIEIEGPSIPTVTTKPVSDVSDNKASCGGNVTADGRSEVTARGVCWSKSEYPTIDGDHTENGKGLGEFTSQMTDLERGATYFVRAYATNKEGTAYGEQRTFTTATGLPQVITDEVTNISATSATCGGDVAANSGYPITARGICWSNTTASPTMSSDHTEEVATTGHFTSMMIGLERNTTYYVRAYAVNEKGSNYGETKIFTTWSGMPEVTTSPIIEIKASTAKGGGNVTSNGGYAITARGICWSYTSSTPTIEDFHTNEVADNGAFTSLMTELVPATTYYVRAYATNEAGTNYGSVVTFTTTNGLPMVSTAKVSNIEATTAQCGGTITSNGGYAITACGVCWSANSSTPTTSDNFTSEITTSGTFTSQMTNLSASTTYYVRAYATNEFGTSYGASVSFTSADGRPIITTTPITKNGNTIISGGNITSDGGSPVTERGVCYGSFPNPDLSSTYSHTSDGEGTGYFTSNLGTSLTGVVYVRAYATNAYGTKYGEQISVDITYLTLPSFSYDGHTYKVAPEASVKMTQDGAVTYCNSLEYCGYTDWQLPSKDILYQMYVNRENIGEFINDDYWSSTCYHNTTRSDEHYHLNFSDGTMRYDYTGGSSYRVRPIRLDH